MFRKVEYVRKNEDVHVLKYGNTRYGVRVEKWSSGLHFETWDSEGKTVYGSLHQKLVDCVVSETNLNTENEYFTRRANLLKDPKS